MALRLAPKFMPQGQVTLITRVFISITSVFSLESRGCNLITSICVVIIYARILITSFSVLITTVCILNISVSFLVVHDCIWTSYYKPVF